jgi:predicted transcriptional regulator
MAGSASATRQLTGGDGVRAAPKRKPRMAGGKKKRNRWATIERIENLRKLVGHVGDYVDQNGNPRDIETVDIAEFLNLTKSGVRKYIVELQQAGVLELVYRGASLLKTGRPVYVLKRDRSAVERFLGRLTDPEFGTRKKADPVPQELVLPANCRLYLIKDDSPSAPRRDERPPFRDPMQAAFFGPART